MGAAYYIVLEKEIDGLNTMMDGKSLSEHIESLDAAANTLGVRPLSEFFSMGKDEMSQFLDEADVADAPPLEHFSAEDGLETVRALLAHTPVHHDHVAEDLRDCERILSAAAEREVRWHFQIDI